MPEPGAQDDRLSDLEQRWQADPSPRVFLALAEEYRRLGRTAQALEVLDQGLASHPNRLSAMVARSRCLLDLERADEALAVLEEIIARDMTHLVAAKLLVEAHLQRSDAVQARRRLELYESLSPGDPEVEALRERILGLQLADATPRGEGRVQPPFFAPWGGAPEGSAAEPPAPPGGAAAGEPRGRTRGGAQEPFHGLSRPGDHARFLAALGEEGLFPLPDRPAPPAAAGEPFPGLTVGAGERWPTISLDLPEPPVAPGSGVVPPAAEEPAAEELAAEEVAAATELAAESAGSEAREALSATATLGQLYLRQGHSREAEAIFQQVLAQDPGNAAALAGLASLVGQEEGLEEEPGAGSPALAAEISAADLIADLPARAPLAAQKIALLKRYLERVRGGAPDHVP